ncbi:hypothetical protein EON63_03790 [archaeon]|nr:MAG: hypothetical protein EON63_03790 [archaeon]
MGKTSKHHPPFNMHHAPYTVQHTHALISHIIIHLTSSAMAYVQNLPTLLTMTASMREGAADLSISLMVAKFSL